MTTTTVAAVPFLEQQGPWRNTEQVLARRREFGVTGLCAILRKDYSACD